MICDTLEHLARYKGLHPNLDTAIDYLLTHDLSALPNGRTEVDGDEVFINVMDAALHPDAGYHPEYHKLYADLQIDITGGEGWGYTNEPGEEVGEAQGLLPVVAVVELPEYLLGIGRKLPGEGAVRGRRVVPASEGG